jgi:RHS repeat-associated protein
MDECNILSLKRRGILEECPDPHPQGLPAFVFDQIDNLGYTYSNNRLQAVNENASELKGYKGTGGTYQYDGGATDGPGNITYDGNKDISIEYNYLNLPEKITFNSQGSIIEWTYDATGRKIKKVVSGSSGSYTQLYLEGVEYKDNQLISIQHEEGRAVPNAEGTGFRQEFVLRDHLGNARVHFSDLNGDGALQPFACNPAVPCVPLGNGGGYTEMLQVQHYYPFGMEFDGPWEMPLDPDEINHYTYNGKELNRDFGLGWLDYGARWYDAVTARWGQVDPLAADFAAWSSYSYSFNNPIRFIDPDGRAPDDPPIGFSQLSYTLHHNYSHTVSYHKELSTKEGNTVTRTVIDETITLSNRGEVLSTNRSTVTSQAEITGERTVSNPLDGMEVTTNVLGEFEEVSSIQDQDLAVENLSSDLQGVVGTIQENTEFNQRYDYIKEDAAEENFIISVAYGTGAFLSKAAPASVKYAGGLIAAGAAYHNSTRDNRGRTVNTLPKVETQ